MTGIAIPADDLPAAILDRLRDRVHTRGSAPEVRFHAWHKPCLLPVRRDGRLELLPWAGWVPAARVEAGEFDGSRPERVVVPACLGFHAGVWFVVREGLYGLLLVGRRGPVVRLLTQPSTNYYRNMTEQAEVMPVLVDQVI